MFCISVWSSSSLFYQCDNVFFLRLSNASVSSFFIGSYSINGCKARSTSCWLILCGFSFGCCPFCYGFSIGFSFGLATFGLATFGLAIHLVWLYLFWLHLVWLHLVWLHLVRLHLVWLFIWLVAWKSFSNCWLCRRRPSTLKLPIGPLSSKSANKEYNKSMIIDFIQIFIGNIISKYRFNWSRHAV